MRQRPADANVKLPSYRRRYTQIFVVLAVAFAIASALTYRYIVTRSEVGLHEAALLEHKITLVNDTILQLYEVRGTMHDFAHTPTPVLQGLLESSIARLKSALSLPADPDLKRGMPLSIVLEPLRGDVEMLDAMILELVRIRSDPTPRGERDEGRGDLGQLHAIIDPHLHSMQSRLEDLRNDLQRERRQQVDQLARVSIGVGDILFAALAAMLALGIAGYLSLDRLILHPILTLADSLKAHASGSTNVPAIPPAVTETQDLLDAFEAMRAQVRQRELDLDYLAHHDALTGLPNRLLFRRRLSGAIEKADEHGLLVGLLFMDLDRFKQINDSYGHATGDQILIQISERLLTVFRQDDLVARLGGDEFAVLLENLHERDEMSRLADKALSAIESPYSFEEQKFYCGASIGIAVAPDDGLDPDRLIQLADAAMYAAKQDEGSSYRYVSGDLTAHAAARHVLENELRDAIEDGELELHYQPVVSVKDDSLHCYEALMRWPHAKQGMLPPASFMGAMIDAGLSTAISDWALDQIETQRPAADAVISFNLSARLLHDQQFADRLFERIDQGRPAPQQLILEITEDTLVTDLNAAARVLQALKDRGVRIALDDFGTGQASLSHLRRFPFDYVKIDRSFTAGIGQVPNDEKLLQAIIRLAHALGMQVVAEGVETEAQRTFLVEENCDFVQGYLVGRPTAVG